MKICGLFCGNLWETKKGLNLSSPSYFQFRTSYLLSPLRVVKLPGWIVFSLISMGTKVIPLRLND